MHYFDHNATTALSAAARFALIGAESEAWHNPSSPTRAGARVRVRLDKARATMAELLGCEKERIVFNSGATEGANAIMAYWAALFSPAACVAVSPVEHPCVIEAAKHHFGERVRWLEVDEAGVVRLEPLERLLACGGVSGVVVMAANNETGMIQPWMEISSLCRLARVSYLCDASQWLGKLPASGLGSCDWLIASAHKFGGCKGTGFLKLPAQAEGFCALRGGAQEGGHRAGTENYPAVAAMLAALAEAETTRMPFETERLRWRAAFERTVMKTVPGVEIPSRDADRLWNTVLMLMPRGENTRWVSKLEGAEFLVSTGAACAAGKNGPSHVLAAMGMDVGAARRAIRISSGWETTEADWQALAKALADTDAALRAEEPGNVVQL